jgi:fumarate reductase flavoprotein subunit
MAVSFDVIVIGAGGAGLTAAIHCREAGASVLVFEAADRTGGSLALSGGVVLAAGTSLQRAAGIEDTAGALCDRYLTLNRWALEPSLAQVLSEDGAEQLEWLIRLGVEFFLLPANAAEYTPRSHMAVGEGARIAQVLDREARRVGAEIRTGSRVSELEPEDGGWRVDLADGSGPLRARAVVITTGGFGQSPEMRRRYFPSVAAFGNWTWSVSAPTCVGDGIELGAAVGAAITGHDQGLAVVTPGFDQNWDVVPPAWLVFVNREGHRYVNEMMPYSMLTATTQQQTGSTAFALFDEASRAQSAPMNLNHFGIVSLDWNRDIIDANVEKGLVF